MPIVKGKGKRIISENIAEILDSYSAKGTIGTSRPANKAAARRQAAAIAYSVARKKGRK